MSEHVKNIDLLSSNTIPISSQLSHHNYKLDVEEIQVIVAVMQVRPAYKHDKLDLHIKFNLSFDKKQLVSATLICISSFLNLHVATYKLSSY